MNNRFPLHQSHLDLAHCYWQKIVLPGDCVVDGTCGNGQDTLALAQLALREESGSLYGFDVLPEAIQITKQRLNDNLPEIVAQRATLTVSCHSQLETLLADCDNIKLIVYNLGYLPGGNKEKTTLLETTLSSIAAATKLISPGGAISITCYSGHAEGAKEEEALLAYCATLSPYAWSCCHHRWINRNRSPTLLLLQRSMPPTC